MIRVLRNLPIKQKLTAITMAISGTAIILACAAFVIYELAAFRRTMERDFAILADMFDDNVASGLAFDDPASLEHTLETLGAHRRIVAAGVYDKSGTVIGTYLRPGTAAGGEFVFPTARPTGQQRGADRLDTFKDIVLAGEVIGSVYIGVELGEVRERAWRYTAIVGLLLAGCSLVALVLTSRLQRIISRPIEDLAQTVATVATEKDYTLRACKESDDELGRLIDGFNEMLAQIQAQDAALQLSRNKLEERVEERTRELLRENIERKRAETDLASSLSVLSATLESTIDGILVTDQQGRPTVFNRTFKEMWRIPADLLDARDSERVVSIITEQLRDPEPFLRKMQGLADQPESDSFDVLQLKDGRIVERYSQPQRVGDTVAGRVWCFRDITDRQRAEEKLAETHKQLLMTSRQAGMAEVATGVLHNVGNVLNSVNVSATLVAAQVHNSKAGNIAKLAALLDEHKADLGGFLGQDPRGQMIPTYLSTLAGVLAGEQQAMTAELENLRNNVEHIKEIVSMQQAHARTSGLIETVMVREMVEDALRMNSNSMTRHDISITRDFQAEGAVATDRHKVIQILINLIRNAKHACEDSDRADKAITLRTSRDESSVRIAVIDNGVGVPAENLTRIFSHGFTTRKDGHGFGLHSAALAAREMGGALTIFSAGLTHGATFTLELPCKATPPKS